MRGACHLIGDMPQPSIIPRSLELPIQLADIILQASASYAAQSIKAFQIGRRPKRGVTLRPGRETPLWNELRAQLRPHLHRYGTQANLARLLGLHRQRVNAFVTSRTQMPDAERTLQLLAWLAAVHLKRRPA